jgi:hypothetical protein
MVEKKHKATHQRLRDGLLKNATIDMGEVDNVRRTDDKGRPLVTAIDLIMRSIRLCSLLIPLRPNPTTLSRCNVTHS